MLGLPLLILIFICCTTSESIQTRKVEAFHSVKVSNGIKVVFTESQSYSLKIEGEPEIIKLIATKTKDKVLSISREPNKNSNKKNQSVIVYISAPELIKINAGSGSSFNADKLTSKDEIKIKTSSGGSINIKELKTKTTADVEVSSGATCKISKLTSAHNLFTITSGGNLKVNLSDSERASVKSSSGASTKLSGKVKYVAAQASSGSKIDIKNLTYANLNITKSKNGYIKK